MPKDFLADNVSMKSHLLEGKLRFLKHVPALVSVSFHYWERGGVLPEMTCALGTSRKRMKRSD